MQKLAILASGMVTGVGLDAPASLAAIRCGITNFQETKFMDRNGKWITGSMVPFEKTCPGFAKLKHMVAPAIRECLHAINDAQTIEIPIFVCVAEMDRPGRFKGLDEQLLSAVEEELGTMFHPQSSVIAEGRLGPVHAIELARDILSQQHLPYCIVAGVDTFLVADTLGAYEEKMRLLTEKNSNGFIPGEAGAAVLLGLGGKGGEARAIIEGIGFGSEKATIDSEEPLRADGLVHAFESVFSTTGLCMRDMSYRLTDANGEQYKFKEGDLAITRTLRDHKGEIDIWHPVDCIGEVGAAIAPVLLAVAETAARKGYSPGDNVLCHFGDDDGARAAMILTYQGNGRG